jgi:hypothetical protein
MGKKRNTNKLLVAKPEDKRSLGRPGCRLEVNIKMDFITMVLEGVYLLYLARIGMSGNEPSGSINCGEFLD